MMHFPPVSDFPLFSKNFRTLTKIFKILPFPERFLDFHPPKFLMTFFLVIDHKFRISRPLFPLFQCISPLFRENYYFPLLWQIPPLFYTNSRAFYIGPTLRVFRFPPTLTMMHLCITQCTYWTPLDFASYCLARQCVIRYSKAHTGRQRQTKLTKTYRDKQRQTNQTKTYRD